MNTEGNRRSFVNWIVRGFLLLLLASALPTPSWSQKPLQGPFDIPSYPNIIVYNGKVVTMDDTSTSSNIGKVVEAMAVRDGYIVALGKSEDVLKDAGPKTLKIDLKGKTVTPGLINSHIHIQYAMANEYFRDHPDAYAEIAQTFRVNGKTADELKKGIELILKNQMANAKAGQWAIIQLPNGDLGTTLVQDKMITKKELDQWAPKTPVLLRAGMYMTNTAGINALSEMTGTGDKPTIPDDDGMGAMLYYDRVMMVNTYFHSPERVHLLAQEVKIGMERHAADGVTTWANALEGVRFWDAFKELALNNEMPNRVALAPRTGFWDNMNPAAYFRRLGDQEGLGTDHMWIMGISYGSMDASPPQICTTMEAPAEVKKRGVCKAESDRNGHAMMDGFYWGIRNRHRLSIAHIDGDKAADMMLDMIEKAMKDDPTLTADYIRSRHFTMDHCTFYPRPAQVPRIAKLGMIISCAGALDGRAAVLQKYFNMSYANWSSPVKSLVKAGVKVSFENNSPGVNGHSYFEGGIPLMTRKTTSGIVFAPEEAIDRNTMMKMMTSWAAEFVGKPEVIGTLELGKWADFVILNKDFLTVPIEEVPKVHTLMTVVGGKIVSLRSELGQDTGLAPVGPQYDYDHPRAGQGLGGGD